MLDEIRKKDDNQAVVSNPLFIKKSKDGLSMKSLERLLDDLSKVDVSRVIFRPNYSSHEFDRINEAFEGADEAEKLQLLKRLLKLWCRTTACKRSSKSQRAKAIFEEIFIKVNMRTRPFYLSEDHHSDFHLSIRLCPENFEEVFSEDTEKAKSEMRKSPLFFVISGRSSTLDGYLEVLDGLAIRGLDVSPR